MLAAKWSSDYEVGIDEIDAQHKHLFDLLNNLAEAMREGSGSTAVAEILNSLADYTKDHFVTEEKYFDQFGYADAEEHKEQHRAFVEEVQSFQADFKAGKMMLSVKIMKFLVDWLVKHIKGSDMGYVPFLKSKGL